MEVDCLPYHQTGYFSPIIIDYLQGKKPLKPFYAHLPVIESFKDAIAKKTFSQSQREVLVEALQRQYKIDEVPLSSKSAVEHNIQRLRKSNCYTVTTGHQLSLFTGPLYFIYKIVSTIRLAKELTQSYPECEFVPLFWMASEDHDFEEIAHFRIGDKKIFWDSKQKGAVGRMSTEGLEEVFQTFSDTLTPYTSRGEQLKEWFRSAYLGHENMAAACRDLVHQLFGKYGLLILDGDDSVLKSAFAPHMKEEIHDEVSSCLVKKQSELLEKHYKLQVNPREINLFYLVDQARNRIVKQGNRFAVVDTDLVFSESEIIKLLEEKPERFSPNVLLRPLYQECILPNLAYIGGGGELAYWFQLKTTFEHFEIPMPVLLLRNSALWMDSKQSSYFSKLNLSMKQLFLDEGLCLKNWVKNNAKEGLELDKEQHQFNLIFDELQKKAGRIDETLVPHTKALARDQEKKLHQLSEKFIRAERRKNKEAAARIHFLKSSLFPNRSLQERTQNFSQFYLAYGSELIDLLLHWFEMPSLEFKMIFDGEK